MSEPAKRGRPRKSDNDFDYAHRMTWYYSRGWRDVRAVAVAQAEGRCSRCGASSARLDGHHKVDPFPTRDVALLTDLQNVEVLCQGCHVRNHHDRGQAYTCETCGEAFSATPSIVARRRFCSIPCRGQHPDFRRRADRNCAICGVAFYPTHEAAACCSQACAAVVTARVKKSRRPGFTCAACGLAFTMPPSQALRAVARPCCSSACATDLRNRR